jgi:hypothetical protein
MGPSANSPPAFAFVTYTGPPSRSPGTQRLVRSHAMRQVRKSRRKGRPVKPPLLQFSLEVPDEPFWDEASLQPLPNRLDGFQEQVPDTDPTTSDLESSHVPPRSTNIFQQRITQYSQNSRQVPNADNSEKEHRQNGAINARIERLWVGRSDPFARYPIEMNLRAYELINHSQYPTCPWVPPVISTLANRSPHSTVFDDRNNKFKPFRDAWFPVGMMDPAAFHQVLANSALNVALLRNIDKAPESYEAMSHHTCAIN